MSRIMLSKLSPLQFSSSWLSISREHFKNHEIHQLNGKSDLEMKKPAGDNNNCTIDNVECDIDME